MIETALYCDICGFVGDTSFNREKDLCPKCSLTNLVAIEKTVTIFERTYTHTCLRCSKTWESKIPNPSVCHYCNNAYWNKPRKAGYTKGQYFKSRLTSTQY